MGGEEWFPTSLGGRGDVRKAFFLVEEPPSPELRRYFMVQLGYHFHSLVYMVALSPIRNDFIEMLLHHVATILLIGCSYMGNYTPYGALIAITHDIGDITGCTLRAIECFACVCVCVLDHDLSLLLLADGIKTVVDTGSTLLTVAMYVVLLVSWGYTRLFVFPTELIYNAVAVLPNLPTAAPLLMLHPVNLMLTMLLVLHVYWYGLFLIMGYNLITKGEKEDIQQKCGAADDAKARQQQQQAALASSSKAKNE